MSPADREHLRIILSVAVGTTPRTVRKALAERNTSIADSAKAELIGRLIEAIEVQFDLVRKPDATVGPPQSSMIGMRR